MDQKKEKHGFDTVHKSTTKLGDVFHYLIAQDRFFRSVFQNLGGRGNRSVPIFLEMQIGTK